MSAENLQADLEEEEVETDAEEEVNVEHVLGSAGGVSFNSPFEISRHAADLVEEVTDGQDVTEES